MRSVLSFVVAAGMLIPAAPSAAQTETPGQLSMASLSAPSSAVESTEAEALRRRLIRADRYFAMGLLSRARKEYTEIADVMRARSELPQRPLWQLASVHYSEGNRLRAAETLDRLAAAAEEHGHASLRMVALIEAAALYEREGKVEEAVKRLQTGIELLNAPGVSSELRATMLRRIRR